jgi:hypothetical protein
MFDRGMIRSIIFLLVILLVTCVMMAPTEGFLGMPNLNKKVNSTDVQNKITKAQNALKRDAKNAAELAATRPATTTTTTTQPTTVTTRPATTTTQPTTVTTRPATITTQPTTVTTTRPAQ